MTVRILLWSNKHLQGMWFILHCFYTCFDINRLEFSSQSNVLFADAYIYPGGHIFLEQQNPGKCLTFASPLFHVNPYKLKHAWGMFSNDPPMKPQPVDICLFNFQSLYEQVITRQLLFRNSTAPNYHGMNWMTIEFIEFWLKSLHELWMQWTMIEFGCAYTMIREKLAPCGTLWSHLQPSEDTWDAQGNPSDPMGPPEALQGLPRKKLYDKSSYLIIAIEDILWIPKIAVLAWTCTKTHSSPWSPSRYI